MKPAQHGTISRYTHHKCRCGECREAKRLSDKAYLDRKGRKPAGNPVMIDGRMFKSQTEAARAVGVTHTVIGYHLSKHGDFSRLGAKDKGRNGGRKVPVRVGSREWPSRMALVRYLGITEPTLRGWLRRGSLDRLLAAVMKADAKLAADAAKAAAEAQKVAA